MTHCTVCGAAAREGAKFCTSCGARLVDTVTAAPEPDATAAQPVAEPSEADAPAETSGDQSESESSWASTVTGNATGEVESVPADTVQPEEVAAEPAESPEYTSSWPPAEDESAKDEATEATVDDVPGDEPPSQPEEAWSSWADTTAEEGPESPITTGGAPDSFATDADQDPEVSRSGETRRPDDAPSVSRDDRPSPFATDADQDARSDDAEPNRDDPMDVSHHGASQWESWAPVASGESTVPAAGGDAGASVRRLLDELANRIDRLIDPAPIAARGVDADELADQLDRWSNASTDADGLLEVVRAVRTSPRDVDALTRLADRAPDLELLVRHYQAITNTSGDWSRKLRDPKPSGDADA